MPIERLWNVDGACGHRYSSAALANASADVDRIIDRAAVQRFAYVRPMLAGTSAQKGPAVPLDLRQPYLLRTPGIADSADSLTRSAIGRGWRGDRPLLAQSGRSACCIEAALIEDRPS